MAITANNTTLTFNDATTQTTSAVTAVNVSTGISSTGGKTPTLTNTGVTSVTAGTGISVSAGTGGVTITNTQPGAVSSVNGQTGAVVTTNFQAVGSTAEMAYVGTSNVLAGGTVAGSDLRYASTFARAQGAQTGQFQSQNPANARPFTGWGNQAGPRCENQTSGNVGIQLPVGSTASSGTWRVMSYAASARSSYYNPPEDNGTYSYFPIITVMRVS